MHEATSANANRAFLSDPRMLRRAQLIVIIGALLLRVLFNTTAQWVPRSDTRDFHEYALNFLSGKGWVNYWQEHPAWSGFVLRQFHAPGFPMFLAMVYGTTGFDRDAYTSSRLGQAIPGYYPWPVQGFHPRYAYLAQIALDMITLILLGRLARIHFGPGAALATQVLFGLYVVWAPNLIAECLFNTLFVSAAYLLTVNLDFTDRRKNIILALVLAAGLAVKMIGVVPIAATGLVALYKTSPRKLMRVALILIPSVLYLGGMAYRAYHYYGHPFIISTGGQHIMQTTFAVDRTEAYLGLKERLGRIPNEYEVMENGIRISKELAQQYPFRTVRLYFVNIVDLFSLKPDWNTEWIWGAAWPDHPFVRFLHQACFKVSYVIYPFALVGLILFWRKSPILALIIVIFLLVHPAVSKGTFRYMAPVACLFTVYAGAALGRLIFCRESLLAAGSAANSDNPQPGPITASARSSRKR